MKRALAKSVRASRRETATNPALLEYATRRLATGAGSALSMDSKKAIELEGKIISVLAGTMFRVQLANDHLVLAHISGKMRKRFIRLTTGDRVKLQMSPYDIDKARIVYRLG